MPGDPSPKAAPGGIIAYNGDSARGWNDPPTFAFNTNKAVNRPKLDLRKRVSHQQALGGSHTPPSAPNAFTSSQEVTDAVAGLKLNGAVQPIFTPPPVTTAPLTNNALTPPTIPPSFTRSVSSPSIANGNVSTIPVSQSPSNTVHSVNDLASLQTTSTEQPSANLIGQPLFHLRSHSYDPVKTAPLHSIRSTAEISEHFDDHHHGHTSPQIFHPVTPMITTTIQTQSVMPPIHTSPQIFHPITHPVTTTTNTMPGYQNGPSLTHPVVPLGHTTPPVVPLGHVTPPPPLPYQPPVGHVTPPSYAVTGLSSAPPVRPTQVMGVTPHLPAGHMTPPPAPSDHIVPPTSLSAGSTPRSSSPSEKDTDGTSLMDDKEGLRVTMDALQDVINKLQDRLQKRVADDISRRLQVMSQNWTNGKLSKGVKSRMIKLAKALDDGNVNEAHHIHVSLMVDFVAEVNQWMVAVKKLISLVRSSNAEVLQS